MHSCRLGKIVYRHAIWIQALAYYSDMPMQQEWIPGIGQEDLEVDGRSYTTTVHYEV